MDCPLCGDVRYIVCGETGALQDGGLTGFAGVLANITMDDGNNWILVVTVIAAVVVFLEISFRLSQPSTEVTI
jgi:hypothetical protein